MEQPRLVFNPSGKKFTITLYENPVVDIGDNKIAFALAAPVREIMSIPVELSENHSSCSISIGVSEDS